MICLFVCLALLFNHDERIHNASARRISPEGCRVFYGEPNIKKHVFHIFAELRWLAELSEIFVTERVYHSKTSQVLVCMGASPLYVLVYRMYITFGENANTHQHLVLFHGIWTIYYAAL